MKRCKTAAVAATVIFCFHLATARAQQTEDASKQAAKVAPTALIKLIGKSRAEVEAALGKTDNVSKPSSGGVCLNWGNYPTGTGVIWDGTGKMTAIWMLRADSWRKTLQRYGLKAAGVKVKKTKGKGNGQAYKLIGVSGIPAGWNCIYGDLFYFNRVSDH